MSDSEFVAALRAERATLARDLAAATAALPAALAAADRVQSEHRAHVEERSRRGDHNATEHRAALADAAAAASNAAADLTRTEERARGRLAEIDRLLDAEDDANRAREEMATASANIRDLQDRRAQLEQIESALQDELAGLAAQRGDELVRHGKNELAARLAGKSAAAPKTLATLAADTESRAAALDAARAVRAETETALEAAAAEVDGIKRRLRDALMRSAELAFFEAAPAFLPILARVAATNSNVGGSGPRGTFTIDLDPEILDAASATIEAEMSTE